MEKKFVLVSVCDREITTTFHETLKDAQKEMREEYKWTKPFDDGNISKMSAWSNGNTNNDWEIFEII